jgi:hypothetical protein
MRILHHEGGEFPYGVGVFRFDMAGGTQGYTIAEVVASIVEELAVDDVVGVKAVLP